MAIDIQKLKSMSPPKGMDFHIGRLGHIVLRVSDLARSTAFYTRVRPSSEWHGVKSLEEAIAHPVPGQDTHLPR